MLGVSVELLDELAMTMEPEDGILWVHDEPNTECRAFTRFGVEQRRRTAQRSSCTHLSCKPHQNLDRSFLRRGPPRMDTLV